MAASFMTDWMEYRFDERGRLESLKDRKSGKDIAVPGSPAFYLADTYESIMGRNDCPPEKVILPEKVVVKGNEIICRFETAGQTKKEDLIHVVATIIY